MTTRGNDIDEDDNDDGEAPEPLKVKSGGGQAQYLFEAVEEQQRRIEVQFIDTDRRTYKLLKADQEEADKETNMSLLRQFLILEAAAK